MLIQKRNPAIEQMLDPALDRLLDTILRQRGISNVDELSTKSKDLLHYSSLKDIDAAASVIADAIEQNSSIFIIGDFDADGATSTALCIHALRAMRHNKVDYIVPNRFDFGYGLTVPVVDIADKRGAQLLITVDNGISSIEGVAHAKQNGMQVVITDHHLSADTLPDADATVNPNQTECQFPSKHIAGVGVAFYVMSAVKNELKSRGYFETRGYSVPNMADYLDLVALGTIADVVKLDKNNRILVHQGLARIRANKTREGIRAILEVASKQVEKCSSSDLGFIIGPRLNAAGRLEDMSEGIECLLSESSHHARQLAFRLDELNQSRKSIEQSMSEQAQQALTNISLSQHTLPHAIVLFQEDFHQGVVGIVAGRLKEKYHRPCIVFAQENEHTLKGSGRSIEGLHIRDCLASVDAQHSGLIKKFGGHAMAAGLSIDKSDFQRFQKCFIDVVETVSRDLPTQASILSDGELVGQDISLHNAHMLKYAFPWGQGFEEPVFNGEFTLIEQRIVGKKHLKMVVSKDQQHFDAIVFNVDLNEWPNTSVSQIELAYRLDVNEFRGNRNVQLLGISIQAK